MKLKVAALCVIAALFAAVIQVYAHHPFVSEFDPNKSVTLKGTIAKFEWGNPHSILTMDVKSGDGPATRWTFELGPPKKLKDFGWKKDMLKMGDEITVNAWRAKDGSNRGSANMITLSNGTKIAGGSSFFDAPREKAPVSN